MDWADSTGAGAGAGAASSVNNDNNETQSRDFASGPPIATASEKTETQDPISSTAGPSPHVHYALQIDTNVGHGSRPGSKQSGPTIPRTFARSDTGAFTPVILRRKTGRAGTFKTLEDFDDFSDVRQGWQPASEPGYDPNKPDGGHASMPTLSAPCEITIVDFSQDQIAIHRKDNETLESFLRLPQPKWVKCRWINVNGLSWDVIKALGRHKNLHKLALEDIMNTRNRTKAEWFPNHAFIVLTLQKLVHRYDPEADEYDSDDDATSRRSEKSARGRHRMSKWLKSFFKADEAQTATDPTLENGGINGGAKFAHHPTGFSDAPDASDFRTLQQYHASPNDPRTEYMEKNSALNKRDLAVACEQVSMFITHDNTLLSFFEMSAPDIETPIIRRLETIDTIIRQSCDASMVGQAIIDAVIDLAILVTACYGDVIGDMELDVLTRANLDYTKKLYVVTTEINKMLSFINPITTLISALRDHKTTMTQEVASKKLQDPSHGVIITPMTHTYLGDVYDHSVLITESLNQLRSSAEGLTAYIFNTVTAYQNESMKQLTIVTVIFLPLTFLTGYFGQNFDSDTWDDLHRGVIFFWKIAIPVCVAIVLLLMREVIWEYFNILVQRRYVGTLKRHRKKRYKSKHS